MQKIKYTSAKKHNHKALLITAAFVLLSVLPVAAACYQLLVRNCGSCTLTGLAGVSPAVPVTCTDPGDNYVSYKTGITGQVGLQSVEWECTYSCLGVDASGLVTLPLPVSPPSSCDRPVSTFAPVGANCGS